MIVSLQRLWNESKYIINTLKQDLYIGQKFIKLWYITRRYTLISAMEDKIVGFENFKDSYATGHDFKNFPSTAKWAYTISYRHDGFFCSRKKKLHSPRVHERFPDRRSTGWRFNVTLLSRQDLECSNWSLLLATHEQRCQEATSKCINCLKYKSMLHSHCLYMPLSITKSTWVDIIMDFMIGLSHKDSIFVVVDNFFKMAISFHMTRLMMPLKQPIYFWRRWYVFMASLRTLFLIVTQSS